MRTLIAVLPVIIFIGAYAVLDPFKVIHRYDELPQPNDTIALGYNQGFASIKALERNLTAGHTYDSFILGSSISQAFSTSKWSTHLPQGASVFHLDASEETVQGIVDKINYLHNNGIVMKNALIIIEEAMLHREPCDDNFLFVRPPATTDDVSQLQFHMLFFNVFKNPMFIKFSLCPERYQDQMIKQRLATNNVHTHTDSTNENIYTHLDSLIAVNPDAYYTPERLQRNYYDRPAGTDLPGITPDIENSLKLLGALLKRYNVNYIVVMPPRFHRQPLHQQDKAVLLRYLDADRVHDLTRHPYANEPRAYYDWAAHLTTARCDTLLDMCY
ncbi:MAG: hypothetical protein MJZ74_09245 [Muribaculaceae bacterium]|nr:hypothetical protein [Muribaculaceae bacterium]